MTKRSMIPLVDCDCATQSRIANFSNLAKFSLRWHLLNIYMLYIFTWCIDGLQKNNIYIYTYIWSGVPCSYPPPWYGSPGSILFPSICKLLAAFLRSSLVFARFLQRFWLPASHLLGTCYLLDDLRSTHTPSKYTYVLPIVIYIYIRAMYLLHI